MAQAFNPYRSLLKIDSAQRPDHYLLLGITRFESEIPIIEAAAEKRILFLQDLANSEHLDASQKLLNEVAGARRCLLSPHDKIAYDEGLRRQQEKSKAKPASQKTKSSKSTSDTADETDKSNGRKAKKKPSANLMTLALLGVVSVLALIVFLNSGPPAGQTNLVLDWPLDQRTGATLLIDSESMPIPSGQPARLFIPEGRRQLLIQRPGFRDIAQTVNFTAATTQVKLQWIPQ